MKKFIINLFSNHFGIILAALNVCYFASRGESVVNHQPGKLFSCANLPAAISTLLSFEFIKIFSHKLSLATETSLANILFVFFIVLQWLFIAWIAKTLAQKFRPTEL